MHNAKHALAKATIENIIELCKLYLAVLDEYRGELHKLPGTPGVNIPSKSSSSPGDVDITRKAIRNAIETTTHERNRCAALLLSFTAVSGYEAVEKFNKRRYKGRDDWTLSSGGVGVGDSTDEHNMTIQEAVDTTSLLRREEHIARSQFHENQQ